MASTKGTKKTPGKKAGKKTSSEKVKNYEEAIRAILNKKTTYAILNKKTTYELLNAAKNDDPYGYLGMYRRIKAAIQEMLKSTNTISILPMVVYGWMPTVLRKSEWKGREEKIRDLLYRRTGKFSEDEMKVLRYFVNNSYIGVSKLLHFTDPDHWAIWDSNVYAAIEYVAAEQPGNKLSWFCTNNNARVNNRIKFYEYQEAVRKVANGKPGRIREIEECIFYVGRALKEKAESKQSSVRKHR